jgi:hypothetical protein
MRSILFSLAALLLTSCSKCTEIVFHPFVYSTDASGLLRPDSQAVVVVSTFGGIPYNVHDYAIVPVWPAAGSRNLILRYPRLRISVIHGNGGYHATIISNDSLYGSDTFRMEWTESLRWPSGDSMSVMLPLDATTILDLAGTFTQGPGNRHRFFSTEMRPFLLALRRRACQISNSTLSAEQSEQWSSAKVLLSVPDSCSLDMPTRH